MTTPSSRPGGAASLVGKTVGDRYKLLRVIGEGGMSAVYAGEHVHMHKPIAVKVLSPEMCKLPEAVTRFQREAVAASRIEHPNVAAATDFGTLEEDGSFFLVLELIEGKTLREAIASGPMGEARAVHIARQIADALARAHGLGIVHRDLKPENVMLTPREGDADFVKILDFGIAKIPPAPSEGAPLTQVGMVYGTPEYMAPEQALGNPVDARADLYSLGVILFEMLAGRRPWDDENKVVLLNKHVSDPIPPLAGVAPALVAIVRKLMAKKADDRYTKAEDVVTALDAVPVKNEAFAPVQKTVQMPVVQKPSRVAPLVAALTRFAERIPLRWSPKRKLAVLGAAGFVVLLFIGGAIGLALHFASSSEGASEHPKLVDHRSACLAAGAQGDAPGVLREASAWVAQNPFREDPEVAHAVAGVASSDPDSAFDLLEHKLGGAGADALYDLAWHGSDASVSARAKKALDDDAVKSHMSETLAVTLGIRSSSNICEAKTKYFTRAAAQGDARTLEVLSPFLKKSGCGRHGRVDCHSCLRSGDDSVEKTVAAIRARVSPD